MVSGIGLMPLFPAFFVYDTIEAVLINTADWVQWYHVLPLVAWIMGAALVVFTIAFVILVRWTLMPRRLQPAPIPCIPGSICASGS